MIRIGLVGCGTVAGYGHLPAIVATPGLQLAALFDPERSHLDVAGEKFGVPPHRRFTDADAFFASEKLDAVTVTSPAPVHFDNVMLAARHNCHVLCEKPLAENEADGQRMIDAMAGAGKFLFVGFIYRFSDMAMRIRQAIRNREIGEVRSLRLIYIWDCHGKYARGGEASSVVHPSNASDARGRRLNMRRDRFMREGGPMVDCGVHQIDLARWWTGSEIVRFAAHGTRIDDDHPCPDHVYLHATHANGVHAMIESSFSYGHTAKEQQVQYLFEAIGTDGVIRFNRDTSSFTLANSAGTTQFPYQPEKNFHAMYAQLVRAIETGDPGNFAVGKDGLIATRIAREAAAQIAL